MPDSKAQIGNQSFEKIELNDNVDIYHEVPNIANTPVSSQNLVKTKENINIDFLQGLPLVVLEENKEMPLIVPKRKNLIEPLKKENAKWAVFASAAPTYNLTNVNPNKDDKTFVTDVKTVSLRSSSRIGIQAELGILRQTSSRLQFFGALNYQWTPFSWIIPCTKQK